MAAAQESPLPMIILDGNEVSATPQSDYVEALLTSAYAKLGYHLRFEPMPLARSFLEANDGVLDGLRARIEGAERHYPNLVAVPYPVLEFYTLLIADRRRCGICDLGDLSHVVTLRGALSLQQVFNNSPFTGEIREVTHANTALDMLNARRTEAAVLPGSLIPPAFYATSAHWISYPLTSARDFHYLHKRHQALAERLGVVLQQMEDSGETARLRRQFSVLAPMAQLQRQVIGSITAISSEWEGYTDTPDGTYWKILRASFKGQGIEVKHALSNWKRAKAEFNQGRYDLLVGAYQSEMAADKLISSLHIDYEQPVVAIGKDEASLHALLSGQLKGDACQVLGYDFGQWLPKNIAIYESADLNDCFTLLGKGRTDMVIDYEFNLPADSREQYQKVQVRESLPVFVIFHNDPRGRLLHHYFEQGFRTLIQSGEAATMFPDPESYASALLQPPAPEN